MTNDLYAKMEEIALSSREAKTHKAALAKLTKGDSKFEWLHVGTLDCTPDDIDQIIHENDELLPPRSGHLGNWKDIAEGRSGAIDYNEIICRINRTGYALIHDFNMTESANLATGDSIYLPGSVVEGGNRKRINTLHIIGSALVPCQPDESLFSPFVLMKDEYGTQPLVDFHRNRMSKLEGFNFDYQSDVIWRNRDTLKGAVIRAIDASLVSGSPTRDLAVIFDRVVRRDGSVLRAEWVPGSKLKVNGQEFRDPEDILNSYEFCLEVATNSCNLEDRLRSSDEFHVLPSATFTAMMLAILRTHYPKGSVRCDHKLQSINVHLHWGALGMAGYPPRARGHFASHARYARRLYESVLDNGTNGQPVLFVLLPSAIYLLWPSSDYPNDLEMIDRLLKVIACNRSSKTRGADPIPAIRQIARDWSLDVMPHLSKYFVDRFSKPRSVWGQGSLPSGTLIEPEYFGRTTMRELTVLVGELFELWGPDSIV